MCGSRHRTDGSHSEGSWNSRGSPEMGEPWTSAPPALAGDESLESYGALARESLQLFAAFLQAFIILRRVSWRRIDADPVAATAAPVPTGKRKGGSRSFDCHGERDVSTTGVTVNADEKDRGVMGVVSLGGAAAVGGRAPAGFNHCRCTDSNFTSQQEPRARDAISLSTSIATPSLSTALAACDKDPFLSCATPPKRWLKLSLHCTKRCGP